MRSGANLKSSSWSGKNQQLGYGENKPYAGNSFVLCPPTGPARFEKSTTRGFHGPQAIHERRSKRSSESVCELVCMPTAATVAIAKWHNPQRASANDRFAPPLRSFAIAQLALESCHHCEPLSQSQRQSSSSHSRLERGFVEIAWAIIMFSIMRTAISNMRSKSTLNRRPVHRALQERSGRAALDR